MSVLMRAKQWTCLPVTETCGNPVSNRVVPREVEKEMLPLSQLPNQKCPWGSCTRHWLTASWTSPVHNPGTKAPGRSGRLEV